MNDETNCPECSGIGSFRDHDGKLIPCFHCRGTGVLKDESAYQHLEPVSHTLFAGLCPDCYGTGCETCRNSGRSYRTFTREIGHLTKAYPQRKPVTKEAGEPEKERKEA